MDAYKVKRAGSANAWRAFAKQTLAQYEDICGYCKASLAKGIKKATFKVKRFVLDVLEFYINFNIRERYIHLPFRNKIGLLYIWLCDEWKVPFLIIDEVDEEQETRYEHFGHRR